MKNIKTFSFMVAASFGLATIFSGCKTSEPNSPTTDEGVVINGVKWATCNVDKPNTFASAPESAGMFYQWNKNVGWSSTDPRINSNGTGQQNWDTSFPTGNNWENANNVCPKGWRVPTMLELQNLLNSGSEWTTLNGINGRKFGTGKNTIFLPAAGQRASNDGRLNSDGSDGLYWSSLMYEYNTEKAYILYFDSSSANIQGEYHRYADCVRCVAE